MEITEEGGHRGTRPLEPSLPSDTKNSLRTISQGILDGFGAHQLAGKE